MEIFSLYNDTNKRMQGAEATVKECKETVGAFEYMRNKLEKENLRPPANGTVGGKVTRRFGQAVHRPHRGASGGDELTAFGCLAKDARVMDADDELVDIKSNSLLRRFYAERIQRYTCGFGL